MVSSGIDRSDGGVGRVGNDFVSVDMAAGRKRDDLHSEQVIHRGVESGPPDDAIAGVLPHLAHDVGVGVDGADSLAELFPVAVGRDLLCQRERDIGSGRLIRFRILRTYAGATKISCPLIGMWWHLIGMQPLAKAEVFESYGIELTRFATSMVGRADAQDVVSEALLRSMWSDNWDTVRNQRAYLYRAVVSQARMNHRAASRRRERERRALPVLVTGTFEPGVDVWEALGHLTVDERAVIFLIYWEDLTELETAQRIGSSERTVRRRLGRARHKLGRLLHE